MCLGFIKIAQLRWDIYASIACIFKSHLYVTHMASFESAMSLNMLITFS